jgi:hypothetical protein
MLVNTRSYTVVAEARGHRVLWFREFGSYQGEWLLFSSKGEEYFVWRGSYGSCSGCDALQATFSSDVEIDSEDPRVQEFIADYSPFLNMTKEGALNYVRRNDSLLAVLPRNQREYYSEVDHEAAGRQMALLVKGEAGLLSPREILDLDNQEIRREAIEKHGSDRFVAEINSELMDDDGVNKLYRVRRDSEEDFHFLYVKDPSTERRYVLRVAPEHSTVRSARASTFGLRAEEFVLAQET